MRYKRAFDKLLASAQCRLRSPWSPFQERFFDPDLQEEFTPEGMNQSAQIIGSKLEIPEALEVPAVQDFNRGRHVPDGFLTSRLLNVMYVDKKLGGVSTGANTQSPQSH